MDSVGRHQHVGTIDTDVVVALIDDGSEQPRHVEKGRQATGIVV